MLLRNALAEQCHGNPLPDFRYVVAAEAFDHLVVCCNLRFRLAKLALRKALVDECPGDQCPNFRCAVVTEAFDHLIVCRDLHFRLAKLALHEALASQCYGNQWPNFRRVVVAEAFDYLVVCRDRRFRLAASHMRSRPCHKRLDVDRARFGQAGRAGGVRPCSARKKASDVRRLGDRALDPLANDCRLHRFGAEHAGQVRQFVAAVEHRHEANQVLHDGRFVAFAPQLVVDAIEPLGGGVAPLAAGSFHGDCAAVDEPAEHGRDGADVHPGARRDLAGARRPPEIDRRQIDPALGPGQTLQMTAKILRVVIDERHQIFHQAAQGAVTRESRNNDQQAGAAAREDLQGPDFAVAPLVAGDRAPQAPAGFSVQRLQGDRPEQFEERLARIVQRREAAGGGGQQHDSGLRLQRLAQPPAEIGIRWTAECLKVLDHEDQPPVEEFGRFEDGGARALGQFALAPAGFQVGMGIAQFPRESRVVDLLRQVEQRFEPEVGETEDLVTFLHEPHRQQAPGERFVGPNLGCDARQQHGLAPAAWRDDQDMLAGW